MEFVSCGYEIPNFSWKVIQNSMVPVTNRIAHDCSCFFLANRLFSVKSLWFENCLLHRKNTHRVTTFFGSSLGKDEHRVFSQKKTMEIRKP